MKIESRNNLISIVLALVILILGYILYDSIVTPYGEVLKAQEVTEQVRTRMGNVRDALIRYERTHETFPENLDSLVVFLTTDSLMIAIGDSIFRERPPLRYSPDSIIYSPRTGNRFEYARNDTLRPQVYLLTDPDSDDRIGHMTRTTLRNAASWE